MSLKKSLLELIVKYCFSIGLKLDRILSKIEDVMATIQEVEAKLVEAQAEIIAEREQIQGILNAMRDQIQALQDQLNSGQLVTQAQIDGLSALADAIVASVPNISEPV